nr:hypothetical protein [Tanacetum cinerariifolium]
MSTFVLCVGCGEPLYGFSPCRWCTSERCGIDMLNGICTLCHLSNLRAYDHNQNSFDCLPDSYHPPHPTYETYSGDTCVNDSHFGYDCPPQFPLNYKPEPGYIHNYNSYPHDSPIFPQQYPCCEDYGVTLEPYQCQPKNHDYYHEQNSCYDSNFIGFDQSQPQQYTVNHPISNAHNDRIEEEHVAKAQNWKLHVCYDDDDDEECSNSLQDNIISELSSCVAVTPTEPLDSLIMEDEHLDTIQATKSDKFIKSCVENLIPIPKFSSTDDDSFSFDKIDYVEASPPDSELVSSEVMEIVIPKVGGIKASNDNPIPFYDPIISGTPPNLTPSGESDFFLEGDMLLFKAFLNDDHSSDFQTKSSSTSLNSLLEETNNFDNSLPAGFRTFSNVLFDADYDSDSKIIPMEIDLHSFNAESDLIESLPNHDSSITISSKIDSLFDEFAGEFTLLTSIPPGIDETDCHPEKEIRFVKRLLYDNSSPRPSKEIVSDNSNADIESFSPSPIPNLDSDPHMEEIDLSFNPDDPMPSGIEDDDYDSERDISILEELLDNYSLSLPANESYHFNIPSSYSPPAKPPDGNTGTLNIKMMGDVSDQKVPIHGLTITRVLNQERSPDLLSHQGLEAFQPSAECPTIINEKNTPVLDVPLFHFYPLDQLKYGGN